MTTDSVAARSTLALLWGAGGAFGKIVGQLLVQITLARILDPVAFGQYAAVIAVVGLGNLLADAGFGSALVQKEKLDSNDVSLALGWSLLFAGLITSLMVVLAPVLAYQFGDGSMAPMFVASALLIPFQVVLNLSSSLLRRDLHMRGIQIIQVVSYTLCFGGVATGLALMGYGVWSLIAGFAAQTAFSLLATYSLARHTLRPRLVGDRQLIRFGLKSLANELTCWSMDNLDRFLVGKFWGVFSLGLYSVAFNLSKAPSGLLINTAQSIAFASAARLSGNMAAVRKGFLLSMAAIALATLPTFALIAFESETVLHIVYGSKWIQAAPYMTALAVAIPLISMGAITAAILRGTGAVGVELRIMLISAGVLFGCFLGMRDESLTIAVWSVPLAYLIRLLLLVAAIQNRLQLNISDLLSTFRGPMILAAIGVLVAVLVHEVPHASSIGMGTLPALSACAAILFSLLARFPWFLGEPLSTMIHEKFSSGRFGPTIAWLERGKN